MTSIAVPGSGSPWRITGKTPLHDRRGMLLAFVSCTVLFGGAALLLPASYQAQSVMMVRPGPQRLVNADPAGMSAVPEANDILADEAAMLTAPELVAQVIGEIGLHRLYPGLAADVDPNNPQSEHDARERALLNFSKHLAALPGKDPTLLTVTFANADPEVASEALRLLVKDYLASRWRHFEQADDVVLSGELGMTQQRLDEVTQRLEAFKQDAHLVDFTQQAAGLFRERDLIAAGDDQILGDIAAEKAQVESLKQGLEQIGASVSLRTDSAESDALRAIKLAAAQLRLKANELRIQFKDGSPQLEDVSRQIALTQSLDRSYGQDHSITSVSGRPMAYDTIQGSLKMAVAALAGSEARLAVMSNRRAEIDRELAQLDAKRPLLEQLQREQHVAADAVAQAERHVTEAAARDRTMAATTPNVVVIQEARAPLEETWTRTIIGAVGVALGIMLAAMLAPIGARLRSRAAEI